MNDLAALFPIRPIIRIVRRLSGARVKAVPDTRQDDARSAPETRQHDARFAPETEHHDVRFALTCRDCGSYEVPSDRLLVDIDRSLLVSACPSCKKTDAMLTSPRIARAAVAAGAGLVVRDLNTKPT